MDHPYAAEQKLVERYLLNELSPELRDQFEDHYFDCQVCAADLKATAAFMDAARTELQKPEYAGKSEPAKVVAINRRGFLPGKPVFPLIALAACLLVIVYQNAVMFPNLRSQIATLERPEILPTLSLAAGNSRGAAEPTGAVGGAKAVLLQFDIPGQDRFSGYTCRLYSPAHALVWTGEVSARQAADTVSVRVPLASDSTGEYSLVVSGNGPGDTVKPDSALATYSFVLNTGSAGAGH